MSSLGRRFLRKIQAKSPDDKDSNGCDTEPLHRHNSVASNQSAISDLELDEMIRKMMNERIGPDKQIGDMVLQRMSSQQKWQMLQQSAVVDKDSPSHHLKRLAEAEKSPVESLAALTALRVCFTTKPIGWLREFAEKQNGIPLLIDFLKKLWTRWEWTECQIELFRTLRAFTNNHYGLLVITRTQELLNAIAVYSYSSSKTIHLVMFQIFSVIAYVDSPQSNHLLQAFSNAQCVVESPFRFAHIRNHILSALDQSGMNAYLVDAMVFVNALLETIEEPIVRIAVRNELVTQDSLNRLQKCECILGQVRVFNQNMEIDCEWMRQQKNPIELEAIRELLDMLSMVRKDAVPLHVHLLSLVAQQLIASPLDPSPFGSLPVLSQSQVSQLLQRLSSLDAQAKADIARLQLDLLTAQQSRLLLEQSFSDQLQAIRTEKESVSSALNQRVMDLQSQVDTLEKEKSELQKTSESNENAQNLKKTISDLQSKVESLQNQLEKASSSGLSGKAFTLSPPPHPPPAVSMPVTPLKVSSTPPPPPSKFFKNEFIDNSAKNIILSSPVNGLSMPPPPPPPNGASCINTASMIALPKPSVKVRQFQWEKITAVSGTIFEGMRWNEWLKKVNLKQIDELFEVKTINDRPASAFASSAALDPKDSNNLNIALRGLKMSDLDLVKALEILDDSVYTPMFAAQLVTIAHKVKSTKLKDSTDPAERLLSELSKVPAWIERLEFMSSRHAFVDALHEARKSIAPIESAIKELESSQELKRALELVLFLGNYLNQGTHRGGARGFRMDALTIVQIFVSSL